MYTRDPHTFKYVHIFKFAYWFIGRYIKKYKTKNPK